MKLRALAAGLPIVMACFACAAPKEGVHDATAVDLATGVGQTARELASAEGKETVLGWNLAFVGDRASFFSCSAEDACDRHRIEVASKAVLAVKVIARTRPAGVDSETDVLRLTLARDVTTSRGGIATDPTRGVVTGPVK